MALNVGVELSYTYEILLSELVHVVKVMFDQIRDNLVGPQKWSAMDAFPVSGAAQLN